MVAQEISGMVLMAFAGVGLAAMVLLSTWMKEELQLPYFALMGTANLCMGLSILAVTAVRGELLKLSLRQWKWVFARGFAGSGTFGLTLMAVATGAPLGDVSALQSVNLVVAALLSRIFLGERLRLLHGLSLCLSIAGALLVSNVGLFAKSEGHPWIGYALALAGGSVAGSLFITARKSQGTSPFIMTSSVTLQEGIMLWLLPPAGAVEDAPLSSIWASPSQSLAIFGALVLVIFMASVAMSAGSQLCPAAVSSTIFTSVFMSLSYAAQVLFQGKTPQALTVLGAALMLSSVILMAFARWYYPLPSSAEAPAGDSPSVGANSETSGSARGDDDDHDVDETESLASFVASEFSGLRSRERRARVAAAVAVFPPVQTIGAAGA